MAAVRSADNTAAISVSGLDKSFGRMKALELASDVELLVLDEPTAGLDPLMEHVFADCVRELKQAGRTILLSSHILAQVEALCDRVSIIRLGHIVESGTLNELRHLTRTTVTAQTVRPATGLAELTGVHGPSTENGHVRFDVDGEHLDTAIGYLHGLGIRSLVSQPPTFEQLFMRRAEQVRSNVVGRHAPLTAAMGVVAATNVLLAVLITPGLGGLGIEGITWSGALLYGVAHAATGLVFAAVAAVTVQVTEHSRGAHGSGGRGGRLLPACRGRRRERCAVLAVPDRVGTGDVGVPGEPVVAAAAGPRRHGRARRRRGRRRTPIDRRDRTCVGPGDIRLANPSLIPWW